MARVKDRAASAAAASGLNDDIGEEMRLKMFRMLVTIREAEQRAYDLFLQNLVKGTSHLSLGQEAVNQLSSHGQQTSAMPAVPSTPFPGRVQ